MLQGDKELTTGFNNLDPISRRHWLKTAAVVGGSALAGSHNLMRPKRAQALDPVTTAFLIAAAPAAVALCTDFIYWFVKKYVDPEFSSHGEIFKRELYKGQNSYHVNSAMRYKIAKTPKRLAREEAFDIEEDGIRVKWIVDAAGNVDSKSLRICPLEIPYGFGFVRDRDKLIQYGDFNCFESRNCKKEDGTFPPAGYTPRKEFDPSAGKESDRQRDILKRLFRDEYSEEDPNEWFIQGTRQYRPVAGMVSDGFLLLNKRSTDSEKIIASALREHKDKKTLKVEKVPIEEFKSKEVKH